MELIKLRAGSNDEGRTIFKYLIKTLNNIPVSRVEKLFRQKDVKLNGKRISDKNVVVSYNDEIWVYGLEDAKRNISFTTPVTFKKIFEDDNILVVEKPINIAIHGEENCLDNQVLTYLDFKQKGSFTPSHVGRIDKSTSGLVLYAKTYSALVQLNEKTSHFEKYYLLKSDFDWDKKHVVFYSQYDTKTKRYLLNEKGPGEKMETIFFKEGNKRYARIITGKKHQIRITLQKLEFPIKGDRRYGGDYGSRVFLHSHKIVFHNLEKELEYLNGTSFVSNIKW